MLQWCDCYAPVIGRVLMGGFFLWSGITKIPGFDGLVGYVASAGLPFATLGATLAIAVEIVFGLMLILGWNTRIAALSLAVWTIIITGIYHTDFSQQMTMVLFLKNLAITGGLLYMSAFSSGTFSLHSSKKL